MRTSTRKGGAHFKTKKRGAHFKTKKRGAHFNSGHLFELDMFWSWILFELLGKLGHGAVLCADEGTHLDGQLVSLGNGFAVEDGSAERTGE